MSARIQKIKDTYSQQFQERLKQEKVTISLDSAWDILVSSDQTKNRKNVRWLVETYINKGYLWEDIASGPTSKVAETLVEFDKHKRNLVSTDRSLMKYQTLGSLWSSIKPYVGQLTPGEEKREERDKAYAEAEVIVDREDGLKIVVPMTEYASKWFGRGTRWCTSADNDNMFKYYAIISPLFIIFMPDGDKLQLWKGQNRIQFMDDNDNDVSLGYIEDNWDILKPICKWTKSLSYIPLKYRDYDICLQGIKHNGVDLELVPKELWNKEMCLEAIKNDRDTLSYFSEELRTRDFYLEAVKTNGAILCHIPMELRDREMCMEAVRQNGWALQNVPTTLKDYKMCMEAVLNKGVSLQYIPKELRDYDMCLEAVKQDGRALKYVPLKLRDYDICLQAIKQDGMALQYIPLSLRDYDMCMTAVNQNGRTLGDVPKELLDKEICLEAIKNNGLALIYIPMELRDNYDIEMFIKSKKPYIKDKKQIDLPENIYQENIESMKELFQLSEPSLKM